MWASKRRVILVGKTGNGKSSTGNLILGTNVFEVKRCAKSVTKTCTKKEKYRKDAERYYKVVDTPGLFDKDVPFVSYALEIHRSLDICSDPHAFLLVFSSRNRLSQEEKNTIDALNIIFGETFYQHAIIVFTAGNDFMSDADFKDYLDEDETLKQLINDCKDRVVRVDSYGENRIDDLLEKIEEVSRSGKNIYKDRAYGTRNAVLKKAMENHKGQFDVNLETHMADIQALLKERLEEEKKENKERNDKIIKVVAQAVFLLTKRYTDAKVTDTVQLDEVTDAVLPNALTRATDEALPGVLAQATDAALSCVLAHATDVALPGVLAQATDAAISGVLAHTTDATLPGVLAQATDAALSGVLTQATDAALPGVLAQATDAALPGVLAQATNAYLPSLLLKAPAAFLPIACDILPELHYSRSLIFASHSVRRHLDLTSFMESLNNSNTLENFFLRNGFPPLSPGAGSLSSLATSDFSLPHFDAF